MSAAAHPTAEGNQSLWFVVAAPIVWAAHFLASYAAVAVWCARYASRDGSLGPVRVAVGLLTGLALGAIAAVAARAWRRYRHRDGREATDADTAEGRHRFVGSATLLLAALSAVATAYSAMAVALAGSCR